MTIWRHEDTKSMVSKSFIALILIRNSSFFDNLKTWRHKKYGVKTFYCSHCDKHFGLHSSPNVRIRRFLTNDLSGQLGFEPVRDRARFFRPRLGYLGLYPTSTKFQDLRNKPCNFSMWWLLVIGKKVHGLFLKAGMSRKYPWN